MATDEILSSNKKVPILLNSSECESNISEQMSLASITTMDSISKILSRPYLLYTGVIPSLSSVNTIIYESEISPIHLYSNGTTRLKHVSTLFKQWNGEITFRFRFTKTLYVEGKLVMAFIPGGNKVSVAQYSVTDLMAQESSMIINLANSETAEYSIPYISTKPWLDMDEISGVFTVRTFQPLVVSVTNAANIPFAVEVYIKRNGQALNLRYLTSLSQGNAAINDFHAYDQFNTIDTANGVADTNIQSPTVQRGGLISMGIVPPGHLLANVNSSSPLYQMPAYDVVSAGNSYTTPTYWSSTGHFMDKSTQYIHRTLNNYLQTPISVASYQISTTVVAFGAVSTPPVLNGREITVSYGSSATANNTISSATGQSGTGVATMLLHVNVPTQIIASGHMRLTVYIENTTTGRASTLSSTSSSAFSIVPNSYGGSQLRIRGNFTLYTSLVSGSNTMAMGVASNVDPFATNSFVGNYTISIQRVFLANNTIPQSLSLDGALTDKIRQECTSISPAFPQVLVFSMVDITNTLNMFDTWISSTSYSHSEQLSFNTQSQQAGRSERRDTDDSFFDKISRVVSDIFVGNTVIGDVLTIAGNVLEFVALFASDKGDVFNANTNPIAISLIDQSQLVRRVVNKDKTVYVNAMELNHLYDDNHPLRALRAKQYTNFTPLALTLLQNQRPVKREIVCSTIVQTLRNHHATTNSPYQF